ncbi:glycosyltransferase family 2 protein [Algoriphagus sp. NF]|uniref:Glycosyltransferase family 2 protein n=1 Tax=Algoriphagus marincola TaxID=264027 RepID=A0ABS7N606_9BACT|nr:MULTISPECIES: glycosyltransferase family 2 protein [Algoriphagus]MBY5951764.1 glycosyltransferase family 2 protein [Algoriphagus marincola]MCR9084098.1 glycosyltransferase family 2 protein [Cyclobacteriaceae bacterium]MDE0559399.1 glycosyltransferase family 2 protein [Algoriphagus sp. NF]
MAFIPNPSVAIILINWNGLEFTRACLSSLEKVDFPDFQVILVDNDSKKPEGQVLKKEFPKLVLLENEQNLGFAGGNNVGIRKALEMGFSHIMLLNNDTLVEPDFLGKMMLAFSKNPKLGLLQPMICFLDEPEKIWSAGGKFISLLGRAKTLGDRKTLKNYQPFSKKLDWATGCCMLFTREAILQSGLLNEQYFAYFEDVEWSLRIRNQGFEIGLVPEAKIYHEAGGSSKKSHSEGTLSARVFYYHVRNQFFLLRSQKAGLGFLYHLGRFKLWIFYFLLRGRFRKLKAVAKGIKDGLFTPLKSAPKWP